MEHWNGDDCHLVSSVRRASGCSSVSSVECDIWVVMSVWMSGWTAELGRVGCDDMWHRVAGVSGGGDVFSGTGTVTTVT